jgi:cell division protein FtsW (lipid II flippase)
VNFRHVAILTSLLFLVLALGWMLCPEQMLTQWGVQYSDGAGVVSRRGAAFYIGVAIMFFVARNVEHSATRMALIKGIITICTVLILLAAYEFSVGHVSNRILIAALIEAILGLAFLYVWRTSIKKHHVSNKLRTHK